jgi:cell fate regulator YaaT (PSP1 superfamily)
LRAVARQSFVYSRRIPLDFGVLLMDYVASVRYGESRVIGQFFAKFPGLHMAERCIIRTERGVEIGDIISTVQSAESEINSEEYAGEILRKMTDADRQKYHLIKAVEEPKEFEFCQRKIRERALPMKLCSVEHLFGGTKVIFHFLAEERVDFRALVKDLAQEYHSRIEMRQIGVRDEARILAHYEHCGRELCCRTFIKRMDPVTMKMAKSQKATLDPNKISGRCGRLMCCLRFEDAMYEELKKLLPRKGTKVVIKEGKGVVTGSEILAQRVTVELEDGRDVVVHRKDLDIQEAPPPQTVQEDDADPSPGASDDGSCQRCCEGGCEPNA